MKKRILFLCILQSAFLSSQACDFCGCFMGITPYDVQSSVSLVTRYKSYNGYESMNQSHNAFPDGFLRNARHEQPNEVLHNGETHGTLSPDEYEVYRSVDLRGKFYVHRRVEINAVLPYIRNKHVHPEENENYELNGLGDFYLSTGVHIVSKPDELLFQQRLIAGAGVKLPTGKNNLSSDGIRMHADMQPGTGSADGFAYLNYITGLGHWGADLFAMHKVNGENYFSERITDNTTGQLNLFYKIKMKDWYVIPSVQSFYEYTKGMVVNDELQLESGSNLLTAGLGADLFYKNIGLRLTFQLPVYEKLNGDHLSNSAVVMAGLSYNFNQLGYLLGK